MWFEVMSCPPEMGAANKIRNRNRIVVGPTKLFLFLFLILFAALISGGQLITSNHMKTSRHLTETPGARERTSDIGDDKPDRDPIARGASNFQAHHMFRPMVERCYCRTSPVEISGQYTSLYSLNLQNMAVPSQNTVQTCRAMKSFRVRCWISAAK